MPKDEEIVEIDPSLIKDEEIKLPKLEKNFASTSERSYIITGIVGAIGLTYIVYLSAEGCLFEALYPPPLAPLLQGAAQLAGQNEPLIPNP